MNTPPKFFQVGGSVRDKFMDRKSNDVDWVVVGASEEWMLVQGFKKVGADFPVFLDPDGVEFALARTERKSGVGYHGFETSHDPSVTLRDDLSRRDLTINAIAYDPFENEYIDPFNGVADIKNYTLRHVSVAFREDPVRVLRLARFHAQFGIFWQVAPETIALCREMVEAGELAHLTKERIWKEFEKALNSDHVDMFLHVLRQTNALKVVFPLFHKRYDAIMEILRANDTYKGDATAITRFTMIMTMFNPTTIEKFCEDYRVPNEYRDYAIFHSRVATKVNLRYYRSSRILVEMLNSLGIYRGNHTMLDAPWKAPHLSILKSAYERTKHVNFACLTEEEQKTLKGKEISAALDKVRQKILD